jgi:hypothetical protein
MNAKNPQEWSGVMAKEICKNFTSENVPREPALQQMFSQWITEIVAAENKNLLDELTNLAFKETDSGKRAGYFKLARMVQARIPVNLKSASEGVTVLMTRVPTEEKELETRLAV